MDKKEKENKDRMIKVNSPEWWKAITRMIYMGHITFDLVLDILKSLKTKDKDNSGDKDDN